VSSRIAIESAGSRGVVTFWGEMGGFDRGSVEVGGYKKVNDYRSIEWDTAVKNLLPDVVGRLS